MKLLTDELREQIPPLYSTEGTDTEEKQVIAKFFFLQEFGLGLLLKDHRKIMISYSLVMSLANSQNGVIFL